MTTIDSLTDAASAADIRELPIPPYRSATLPAIDYDAHPAYGGFLPKPTLRERIHAMNVFLRTFGFVTLRRIVDYENMPLLTKETGFKGLNFSTALRFMSMYATIRASRLLRTLTGQQTVLGGALSFLVHLLGTGLPVMIFIYSILMPRYARLTRSVMATTLPASERAKPAPVGGASATTNGAPREALAPAEVSK